MEWKLSFPSKKGVKVDGIKLHVNNTILFWRLICIVEWKCEFQDYQLTEVSTNTRNNTLLKKSYMKKADKASLITTLTKTLPEQPPFHGNTSFVLDGGALLHQVRWDQIGNYATTMHHDDINE